MRSVTVYGASDDLVEVEGDIVEEFDVGSQGNDCFLAFSDGTVLSVRYDGFWRIHRLAIGSARCVKRDGTDEDTDYSDRVTLTGDIRWVVCGDVFAKAAP
jgi:hypothetical protein